MDRMPLADEMDRELHPARIKMRRKVSYEAAIRTLPDGCFVQLEGRPYLLWGDSMLPWTPEGYMRREARPDVTVTVLTPEPIVECLRHGYGAELHVSEHLH